MEFKTLLKELLDELNEIKNKNNDIIQQANSSIVECRDTLYQMSQLVSTTCFLNETDEIHFFKHIKVYPLSKLVYYSDIRAFEIQYPKVSIDEQKKYLEKKIRKVNKFFDYNIEFIQYVKEERTHFDALYYTRKNSNSLNITNTKTYYRAPDFSTSHDILLGKVKAYESLVNYLENRLFNILNPRTVNLHDMHKKSKLRWTSSKVALTELIYALHCSGAINSGAVDISEIAAMTEKLFNVELGDYYRTYLALRGRKINRTKFLDNMKECLIQHMEEKDA